MLESRTRIVEGEGGMVQMALERLEQEDMVELDDERRAAMVSNLLGSADFRPVERASDPSSEPPAGRWRA